MKNRKFSAILAIYSVLTAIIALSVTSCQPEPTSTPTHVHDWSAWTVTTPATCTTAGEETRTCKLDATHKETRAGAAALGHDYGEWAVTTPPTTTTEGIETRTCKRDATHTETRAIDKLPDTEPKNQTATITNLFNKGYNATVTGYLTDTEWNGVADKIKAAFEARYKEGFQATFESVFSQVNVTIIIEKDPTYANYSTTKPGNTAYINYAILNDINVLGWRMGSACHRESVVSLCVTIRYM